MNLLLPFTLACCYAFYMKELPYRFDYRWYPACALFAFSGMFYLYLTCAANRIHWLLSFLLYCTVLLLYLLAAHVCSFREALYHTAILYLAVDCIVSSISHLSMIVFEWDYINRSDWSPGHLIALACLVLFVIPILCFVKKFVFRRKKHPISWAQLFLLLMTILPILYVVNIHEWIHIDRTTIGFHASVIRIILSFCGLVSILGSESLYENRIQEKELETMEQMLRSQYEQFCMRKENAAQLMQQCHDLKNQFYALQNSGKEAWREAYLQQLQETMDCCDALYHTGNETLDIILSDKALLCRDRNITMVCIADGTLLDALTPIDISTIFGNALDNAIEAASAVPKEEKRLIQVKVLQERSFLVIRFENTYAHALTWSEDGLQTTKKETAGHGFGLRGIRYTAERYGGNVTIDTNGDKFILTILLPVDHTFA